MVLVSLKSKSIDFSKPFQIKESMIVPVSYTHLDVYKRQVYTEHKLFTS